MKNTIYWRRALSDLTSRSLILDNLNQIGIDLAFSDLSNFSDVQAIQMQLDSMHKLPGLPADVEQIIQLGLTQLPVWAAQAQVDVTAAMVEVGQWFSQAELLCLSRNDDPLDTDDAILTAFPDSAISLTSKQQFSIGPALGVNPAQSLTEPVQTQVPPDTTLDTERIELNLERDADLLREFCNEASELLSDIEQGLLTLEARPQDKETLNAIFRAFHTFKGGAGMLKLLPIQHMTHQLESILDKARRNQLTVDANVVSLILQAADGVSNAVNDMLTALSTSQERAFINFNSHAILANVARVLNGDSVVVHDAVKQSTPSNEAPNSLAGKEQSTVTQDMELTRTVWEKSADIPPTEDDALIQTMNNSADTNIKVGARKLDELIDLVGELMIAQSMVTQHEIAKNLADDGWERAVLQLSRITKELQRTTMLVRMVPVFNTFKKMTRLVRDLSAQQNKLVDLVLVGESLELDRSIVDALAVPLAHMIRNAVGHGIEQPDERTANGKSERGRIVLSAFQRGGSFVIQISDDGRGLSRGKIRDKAIAKGLITQDQVVADADLFDFIFNAGFSTVTNITDVSGRGVGMDVVKQSMSSLRGTVDLESEDGLSTQITITLPLTLAIIDGLVVLVGRERYILPALMVRECLRPTPEMLGLTSTQGEVVRIRDQLIPIVKLSNHFHIADAVSNPCQGILVVVETGRQQIALMADQILDKQELVIKSLGASFQQQTLLSGASVMSDGLVSCILNLDALAEQCNKRSTTSAQSVAIAHA